MNQEDFSPVSVVPFSEDFLTNYIRFKTGWNRRSSIALKRQLAYLYKYLQKDHIKAATIVVENEYIDRNFLEDYAEYYARCFPQHPRFCARIHFFESDFSESTFTEKIAENDQEFIGLLSKSYLGFVVVRPIPDTFLAKACLIPYPALSDNPKCCILTNKHSVSLFGVDLHVKTAAFIEQDKVVSACATSALWVLLNLNERMGLNSQPSPSAITKAAINGQYENTKTFPSSGLTLAQIERALKHFDLEPITIDQSVEKIDANKLKEISFGYINHGLPLLVGGRVYRKLARVGSTHEEPREDSSTLVVEEVGPHVICCLGYKIGKMVPSKLYAHSIDRLYVHDDRLGFYARMLTQPVQLSIGGKKGNKSINGFEYGVDGSDCEYFAPEFIIVGAYHKIRLSYSRVSKLFHAWEVLLTWSLNYLKILEDKGVMKKGTIELTVDEILKHAYAIQLTTSSALKASTRECNDFFSFNGASDKSSLLFESMPKFLWTIVVTDADTGLRLYQLIFDATEVPQGRVFTGYVCYSGRHEGIFKWLEKLCKDNEIEHHFDNGEKEKLAPITRLFDEERTLVSLNTLYGPLRLPVRQLKTGEYDEFKNLTRRSDVLVIRRGNVNPNLDEKTKYIWVINEAGDIVLGPDIEAVSPDSLGTQGHPTLMDGKPGRIAGELEYDNAARQWVINSKSGAYSVHLADKYPERKQYLENVVSENLNGLPVRIG